MKLSSLQGARILATGSAVPSSSVSNDEISNIVDTSDEWIVTRTGIKERRICQGFTESVVDLATLASKKALLKAKISPLDIDLIILATSSPNDLFGSASQVQFAIGAINAAAFDLTAACSGFLIGLVTATQFIQNGNYQNILIVGADVLSKWVDWSDRSTCILFGDGAGALILQSCSQEDNQILDFNLNTDGKYWDYLSILYNNTCKKNSILDLYQGSFNNLYMNGKEVYKFAVSKVPLSISQSLRSLNLSVEDISWLLLHQANERILAAVADKLSIHYSKVISNVQKYGNTSAASIPIALDEAFIADKITHNDIIVISGFGAGLTWGTIIVKWKLCFAHET
uniref:Beta-ketoacyl-[acyl-carrier-protein] synthase III n=1 Tax=Anotrichium furcellatum TaxID=41999 RepID=A0A4D6WKP4_9FLOR|nr:beta-ketoacyl-acyl carrier protein synthase III [Anotrichium furcellatum]